MHWDNLTPTWQACLEEAWLAYCAGSVPIGAVVTDARGAIIGRGRNRITDPNAPAAYSPQAGPRSSGLVFNHDLAHAELNALLSLHYSHDTDTHEWTLFTTMEPCPLCLGALYMSCLRELHYAARDPYAGSTNLLGATPYLSRKPIRFFGPVPDLETVSVVLVVESSMLQESKERSQFVRDVWRKTIPLAVALGERLFERQVLRQLRTANATAAEMVSQVTGAIEA